MNEESTELVVEIAKEFMTLLQESGREWSKGFFRFKSDDDNYGANASYVVGENVSLISAMKNREFYNKMNELGRKLVNSFGKTRGVFLVIADSSFDYEIKFEWDDLSKWEITKLDQNTGIPAGI